MWLLIWFQLMNNKLQYYQIGQYPTQNECMSAKNNAMVLVTGSSIMVHCFEVIPK